MKSFLLFLPFFVSSQHLQCYHCINQLSTADISKQEQNTLKMMLFSRFNIPPSNEYCADGGNGVLFQSVQKESCYGENDTCVRIILEGDATKKLVLRGCESTLQKSTYNLFTNYSCRQFGGSSSETTECISTCQEPLCNISSHINLNFLILISFVCILSQLLGV